MVIEVCEYCGKGLSKSFDEEYHVCTFEYNWWTCRTKRHEHEMCVSCGKKVFDIIKRMKADKTSKPSWWR